MTGQPAQVDLGIGKYGALGLAFMAAVVSAAISWGIQLDRSDQASDQITSLSNRMNTLAVQVHNNTLNVAIITERLENRLRVLEDARADRDRVR